MPPSNAQIVLQQVALWNRAHPHQQIDPQAEIAVATHEGLSGGIGDGGHAFGPNQENNAGGVLTGRFPGATTAQLQAWAWSPAGIQDALSRIASVAANQHGAQAVQSIVRRFERPADPTGEVNRSLASLGLPAASGSGYQTGGQTGGAAAVAGVTGVPAGQAGGIDALAALLLSQQFQPPPVDATGTTANPAVVTEATNPPDAVDALSLARQFLDASKGAFTNPGFAQYLHGLNGTQLPSSTIAQSAAGTHTKSPSAGDVAFFGSPPTHQAVMLDGEHALHATNGGTVLRVSSLAHPTYAGGLSGVRSFA